MKNIHVLPTDKPSRLSINYQTNLLQLGLENRMFHDNINIYITSDEEIKEGDWCLLKSEHSHGRLRKCHYIYNNGKYEQLMIDPKADIGFGFCKRQEVYKIIITTDQDLIKDGIQAIDDDFLEWFVKNPSCERVEVKDVYKTFLEGDKKSVSNFRNRYKIIIPKEEPCTCTDECLSYLTKTCKRIEEEPKQETLEEVAKSHAIYELENNYKPTKESFKLACKRNFIRGAKWQAERSYSEEEVVSFIHKFLKEHQPQLPYLIGGINMWFEHFKKK